MWSNSPAGTSFVPNDLTNDILVSSPDERFPEFFQARDSLRIVTSESGLADFTDRLLFQREAQVFSPRLSSERSADLAYLNYPFVAFYAFDSVESFHFANAAQYAWTSKASPYSKRLLCGVHRRLLPDKEWSGKFRHSAVWMGYRKSQRKDPLIMLPPSDYVEPAIRRLSKFATQVPQTHRLAACAMMHLQFIAIHPFGDGNGRVARIIAPLSMAKYHLLNGVTLFLSEILLERRWEYYGHVESAERYDEIVSWIQFFVEAATEQLKRHEAIVRLALRLRENILRIAQPFVSEHLSIAFAEQVVLSPTLSLSRIAKMLRMDTREALRFAEAIDGRYGFGMISDAHDPAYQFRDIYDLLEL
jgi:hypothetical protein